jgi:hypothetical protein
MGMEFPARKAGRGERGERRDEYLVVVVAKAHLKIESHELSHVAMGVRVLRAEDGSDFEHSFEVGAHCHLLVELGGLGEESLG